MASRRTFIVQRMSEEFAGIYWLLIDLYQEEPGGTKRYISASLDVPVWQLVILFSVLPLIWLKTRLARTCRPGDGFCAVCGYDLRATPERCPECGHVTKPVGDEPRAASAR